MFAVIKTGGKQYRVSEGETIEIEKLPEAVGDTVEFKEVSLIADGDKVQVGGPLLAGALVKGEVVAQGRGDKVRIIKFRRRKHHMKQQGHRQYLTKVKITGISARAK